MPTYQPRYQPRYDVSEVPPQGAYVARRCPVRAQLDNDPPPGAERAPDTQDQILRMREGDAFEEHIVARLRELHPGPAAEFVTDRYDTADPAGREAAAKLTLDAMAAGVPLVVGAVLPDDLAARRSGRPDLLVRAGDQLNGGGRWPYVPVDVKHHLTAEEVPGAAPEKCLSSSSLARPEPAAAKALEGTVWYRRKQDALQLAHYHRMLETLGHAPDKGHVGGIIGKEEAVTWIDLDAPRWSTPSSERSLKDRSTMECYDFEFSFRLDVVACARQRRAGAGGTALELVPVRISECPSCPWRDHCLPSLAACDDVSLLPRVGWQQRRSHHEAGSTTRADVGRLDWATAHLIDCGVDVAGFLDAARSVAAVTLAEDLPGMRARRRQLAVLEEAGYRCASDLAGLDAGTAHRYRSAKVGGHLADQVDIARAVHGRCEAYLSRHQPIEVPRATVEIDIDMESTIGGDVYLWGALVTDRSANGVVVEPGYHAFCSFDAGDVEPSSEDEVFARMWSWLAALLDNVESSGASWCAYCFHDPAERVQLRRLATSYHGAVAGVPSPEEVERIAGEEALVDLLPLCRRHIVTGGSYSLKHVAPLAGFGWHDAEAGGANSMVWHQDALSAEQPERGALVRRILTYNEDDVRATLAVREWLCAGAPGLLPVEALDPRSGGSPQRIAPLSL